mmetsp:Transcript_11849/g.25966  ORF Transcript_11849/g.25966 Transcript_11849/m.25966 type:complete len:219 (-) Transcript_11849:15-671(-)
MRPPHLCEVSHGEVGGQGELVLDVCLSATQHGGVHRDGKCLVPSSLGALDEVQSDGSVLVHVQLEETEASGGRGSNLLQCRGAPAAQAHEGVVRSGGLASPHLPVGVGHLLHSCGGYAYGRVDIDPQHRRLGGNIRHVHQYAGHQSEAAVCSSVLSQGYHVIRPRCVVVVSIAGEVVLGVTLVLCEVHGRGACPRHCRVLLQNGSNRLCHLLHCLFSR